jgi:hypothetical protein
VLTVIDSLLFGSAVVTDTYLKKIDLGDYIVSHLATGMTFFHLAVLLLPYCYGVAMDAYFNNIFSKLKNKK